MDVLQISLQSGAAAVESNPAINVCITHLKMANSLFSYICCHIFFTRKLLKSSSYLHSYTHKTLIHKH
jgi:hypothetical protein